MPPSSSPERRLQPIAALGRFLHSEVAAGVLLLCAAVGALVWANSPLAAHYEALWHLKLGPSLGAWRFEHSLHFWVNEVLMTLFFLVVGLEVRREMHDGALSRPREAALPVVAALGGVAVPALIYLALNATPVRQHGWAVPTATDIAFAIGILALLGRSVPPQARIFLLALAIIDDIVAVLIIALFYSGGLDPIGFLIAGAGIGWVLILQRLRVDNAWVYVLPGALIWFGLFRSGAHPTLTGVVLGMMTPVRPPSEGRAAPVERVQNALHPWVSFGIMPVFALANAGVVLSAGNSHDVDAAAIMSGIAIALVVGKPVGVVGASWLLVRLGWGRLPPGVGWRAITLVGLLAGIGFTMSIFIALLAFPDPAHVDAARMGVLAGSLVAALLGLGWGWLQGERMRVAPAR